MSSGVTANGDIGSGLAQALISDEVKRYNELP
jgi:hypothetical protein